MKHTLVLIVSIAFLTQTYSSNAKAATTILDPGLAEDSTDAWLVLIRLTGEINDRDAMLVTQALNRSKEITKKPVVLIAFLNSPGGNVKASLQLGRLLREHHGLARVEKNSICASACVFVLAGGTARIVEGNVLIHRPYAPEDQIDSADGQRNKYEALRVEVGKFLGEVNIPLSLYDDMLRISPEKAKVLSQGDLERYGLAANDPYDEEANDVKAAKRIGISRLEYARRQARQSVICRESELPDLNDDTRKIWDEWAVCSAEVMSGKR